MSKQKGLDGLLKGKPMEAEYQWLNAARVLALRDILIKAGLTDEAEFNAKTERIHSIINEKREKKLSKKRKRYGFGKAT